MPDFNVRSDSVNVEQIMEQIRARIREKRGVDYTEEQIRELAAVKLEKFLDPRGVRSDLLEQFRKAQPAYNPPELPNYRFEDNTLYESTRGPLRWLRKLLNPILKLFFNPNPLIQALNIQSRLNTMYAERETKREVTRRAFDQLQYELMHNLVIETTRLSIEVKNLKMRVESLTGRLEFNERRARALESVVVYKPSSDDRAEVAAAAPASRAMREPEPAVSSGSIPREPQGRPEFSRSQPVPAAQGPAGQPGQPQAGEGPGQRSRRRRRRRGRRGGGGSAQSLMPGQQPSSPNAVPSTAPTEFATAQPTEGVPTEPPDAPAPASTRDDASARSGQVARAPETIPAGPSFDPQVKPAFGAGFAENDRNADPADEPDDSQ